MSQLALFAAKSPAKMDTFITCEGNILSIPEGLHTIPCTHGLHRFAGKFIPNIPRYIIRDLLPPDGKVIFDPFCGSGTTLVEAALEGKQFIGMDIDPLAIMISKAKTTPLSEEEMFFVEDYWANHNYNDERGEVIPDVPNISHWFNDKTIVELSSIKSRCLSLPHKMRIFSLTVFSSIIRRVSNADDQTQKTYVSHTLPKAPPTPSELFPLFLKRAIKGMREYLYMLPHEPMGEVLLGDARTNINEMQFDDVITSPPYIDSIDYVYNQMLEYFWLFPELGLDSYDQYREFRKKPMGFKTHSLSSIRNFDSMILAENSDNFENICLSIGGKSPKEELAVRSFFFDYASHVLSVRANQKNGAYYVCIVGNSHIRGVNVPTADFVASIHKTTGYTLEDSLSYEIKRHYMKFPRRSNSGTIKQDHIMVFRAT